jgi:chorismate mutase
MPLVVRVLMHLHTERSLRQMRPVYLDGAETLRDDLS